MSQAVFADHQETRQLIRDYGDPGAIDRDIIALACQGWSVQSIATIPGNLSGGRLALSTLLGLLLAWLAFSLAVALGVVAVVVASVVGFVVSRSPDRTLVSYTRE